MNGSIWAAALVGGRLEGLEADPVREDVRWGSIYWAKVKGIDAAIDAAFLDLDGKNTGILFNNEVRLQNKDGSWSKGGASAIGKTFKAGDMVAVQAKNVHLPRSDEDYMRMESKLPQMSMDVTLPGRYLIFCTTMKTNQVSARIREKKLRGQIEKMLANLQDVEGCILRAAAANTQTEILMREGKILKTAWQEMRAQCKGETPGLVMLGPDAIQRILSDQAGQYIERIEIVTLDHFTKVEEWCQIFAPDLVTRIDPIELPDATDDMALFHHRDIMGQIEDLFQPYTLLPGGANIIVQTTATLTAIDVNKGADRGSNLAINIEAAHEAARQIRLRNTGGIVMVDFLKTQSKSDEKILLQTLEEAVLKDPCTVQIHGKTALGLYELTRKRRTPPLQDRFSGTLP